MFAPTFGGFDLSQVVTISARILGDIYNSVTGQNRPENRPVHEPAAFRRACIPPSLIWAPREGYGKITLNALARQITDVALGTCAMTITSERRDLLNAIVRDGIAVEEGIWKNTKANNLLRLTAGERRKSLMRVASKLNRKRQSLPLESDEVEVLRHLLEQQPTTNVLAEIVVALNDEDYAMFSSPFFAWENVSTEHQKQRIAALPGRSDEALRHLLAAKRSMGEVEAAALRRELAEQRSNADEQITTLRQAFTDERSNTTEQLAALTEALAKERTKGEEEAAGLREAVMSERSLAERLRQVLAEELCTTGRWRDACERQRHELITADNSVAELTTALAQAVQQSRRWAYCCLVLGVLWCMLIGVMIGFVAVSAYLGN